MKLSLMFLLEMRKYSALLPAPSFPLAAIMEYISWIIEAFDP
jgi:hypothetical protein